ncbi:MAG: hypothetical protein IKT00_06635 [Prevotella sp.]|nr:hypothetical protein [Prevotella sp.]
MIMAYLLILAVIISGICSWVGMNRNTTHIKCPIGIPMILFVFVSLTSCKSKQDFVLSAPIQGHKYEPEHSPDVFLVMYDAEVGKEPLLQAIKDYKCEIVYDYNFINGMALKKPEDKTLEETMQFFKHVKGVTNVEYDHIIRLTDPVQPRLEIK